MRFLNLRLALALGLGVSIPINLAWSQEAEPSQKGEGVEAPQEQEGDAKEGAEESKDAEADSKESADKAKADKGTEAKDEDKDEAKAKEEPALELPEESGSLIFIEAERLITRPGKEIANGKVIVRNGRIQQVGADLVAPEGARTIKGKVVCAGFIDPWSTLGVDGGSLFESRADATLQTMDALELFGPKHSYERAMAAGVLAFETHIGSPASIGGTGVILRTQPSTQPDDILISDRSAMWSALGVNSDVIGRIEEVDGLVGKLLAGEAHLKSMSKYEKELTEWEEEIAELQKKLDKDFKKAKKDRDKKVKEDGKKHKDKKHKEPKAPRKPKPNPDKEAMGRVMAGEIPLVVRANRAAVLRNLLEATEGLGSLRLVIAGGENAMHVAPKLAARKIPVIVWPANALADSSSEQRTGLDLAGELSRAGVLVLIGSGASGETSALPLYASLAVGHGLDADHALAAITTRVAETFDLQDELGSVRRGRRAELLIMDGEPLSMGTTIQYVVSGGEVVLEPKE
ncbi:MAG: imidazolonepropionase-like amidohydrolase [Planctomycetota bacterium]|jgi:imidazolonepropionase-like amidohydrolase